MATRDDLAAIADVVRGTELMVFSDEPYCHMVWSGRHASILAEPGMLDHTVAAYTFSKSYSMSGWRIGFAVAAPEVVDAIGKLINTTASCSPPLAQRAAQAALEHDTADPRRLHGAVPRQGRAALRRAWSESTAFASCRPAGTFYVFPDVRAICNRLGITSHGLALYLLEGADDQFGVACLGGECFGEAGRRLPALQLRRARRTHRPGDGVSPQGTRAARPRPALPRGEPAIRAEPAVCDGLIISRLLPRCYGAGSCG